MDANGTRFHLLLGKSDWERCTAGQSTLKDLFRATPRVCRQSPAGFEWDVERAEVGLRSCLFEFPPVALDRHPSPEDRRGAARDAFGNFYWIDETSRQIRVISVGTGRASAFWPLAPDRGADRRDRRGEFAPTTPAASPAAVVFGGLAVTADHYLVAGTIDPRGLVIFDLHAGGPPIEMRWPEKVPFTPFDIAARPGGGVWILDRDRSCYWGLDRHFNVAPGEQLGFMLAAGSRDDFQPTDGKTLRSTQPRMFADGIALSQASPVIATDPVAIEAMPDGTVLILDRGSKGGTSVIRHYRWDQCMDTLSLAPFGVTGHDFALGPGSDPTDGRIGRLYVVGEDGNQARAFALSHEHASRRLQLELLRQFLPMRLFSGKALLAAGSHLFYDLGDAWIPLVEQRQPRYVREGSLVTPPFNGRMPDCVWHRLMLDACIPPGTGVRVESRCANDERDLEAMPWMREPSLYPRDASEIPFPPELEEPKSDVSRDPLQPVPAPASGEGKGTWELLFQQARGQYLQLQLTFSGNRRTTPRVRALRAYYPRFSYLEHYMPAVYRDDEQSASFLDRFLANLEGINTDIEDKIAAVQMLFDVRSAPPETLEWLARWFDVVLDPAWSDSTRRLFIRHAMEFFQYRGTTRGLITAARLATMPCPDDGVFDQTGRPSRASGIRIVEKFRTRRTPGVALGDPTDAVGLRRVTLTGMWRPEHGRLALERRYTDSFGRGAAADGTLKPFPIKAPPSEAEAAVWRRFATESLGFVPSASNADVPAWRDFLARRYQRVSALNSAYALTPPLGSFGDVQLPTELPADGPALQDWYQFEAVVLAMRRTAHRFTVLLPVGSAGLTAGEQQATVDLVRRVVDLEKPAHTVFDVKFFWGMFRVGEARLGDDTLVDIGGRAPELMTGMTLGQSHLGESYLAPGHPLDLPNRMVLGADRRIERGAGETQT